MNDTVKHVAFNKGQECMIRMKIHHKITNFDKSLSQKIFKTPFFTFLHPGWPLHEAHAVPGGGLLRGHRRPPHPHPQLRHRTPRRHRGAPPLLQRRILHPLPKVGNNFNL